MNDKYLEKSVKKKQYEKARTKLMSSNLPDKLKITAFHILDFKSSSHDYEWCFAMVSQLVERGRFHKSTVKRHVRALEATGIFKVDRSGRQKLDATLKAKYGRGVPKVLRTTRTFNGYEINWDHPIWSGADLSEEELQHVEVIASGKSKRGR